VAILIPKPRRGPWVAWLLAAALAAGGGRPAPSDREVQAAFLCSFAEFVEWPDRRPEAPVAILVLGDDPFGSLLERTVESRPLQTKPIEIRRSRRLEDARGAQIVFVSGSERERVDEVLHSLAGSSVLTVSDLPGFARRGGIIGFVLEQRHVRFEINQRAAEGVGLRISSRLLTLAHIVETAPRRRS
jgi:hypothetical protein